MTIHTVEPTNLPTVEVLAFGYQENILVGYLSKFRGDFICENEGEVLIEVTHYMLASDLINRFKTATNAQD